MTPTTPSAPDEVVLDENGVVCPKCGGSGDFEEPNPFFDADDEDSVEDEFHKIACAACAGSGKMDVGPCPHCGSRDVFVERGDISSAYVMCNDCACRGPVGGTAGDDMEDTPGGVEAIAAWNRRVYPPGLFRWGDDDEVLPVSASPQPAGVTAHGLHDDSEPVHAGLCRMMDDGGLPDDYRRIAAAAYARIPSPTDTRERVLTGAEYEAIHRAGIDAYEAATPKDYRYSAVALRKAIDAARAVEAALKPTEAPVEDGWIEWDGTGYVPGTDDLFTPVPVDTLVDVRLRNGEVWNSLPAGRLSDKQVDAAGAFWRHDKSDSDIIAYRLAASTKEE